MPDAYHEDEEDIVKDRVHHAEVTDANPEEALRARELHDT
jgi:hypothetical protein